MFSSSRERAIRICLTAIAASSLLALAGIVIFLFTEGLPLFRHVSPLDFLLGDLWYPTEDPGLFGIFPLLVGSVAVTVLSSLLAVPLGVMTAVYLAEIAPPFARRVIKPFVELLAALPSVVLGFLGMVVLAPFLQDVLGAATGLNLLNASLVLAVMSLPTICSVSEDALRAVPRSLREASLALGATRWETIVRVVVPAALSGIGTAIMLGMSRAMGETMVAAFNVILLVAICLFLLVQGLPALSWEFLSTPPREMMTAGGILPCIVGTAILALGSLLLAFPLGVATAVYLHEYAGNAPFARMVRLGVNNLAGVPSVVFGLFGLSFFVTFCGMGVSILSGVLTLAVLTLPVIISTAEESLRSVPDTYRQASLALGAGKAQTIARVVLPCAMPGMLTGAILGVARAAGETAAIMFTAAVFYTPKNPDSLFSSVMALPYHMYVLATAGTDIEKTRPLQYGTGLVLILLVLGMNLLAIILRDHLQRRHHA